MLGLHSTPRHQGIKKCMDGTEDIIWEQFVSLKETSSAADDDVTDNDDDNDADFSKENELYRQLPQLNINRCGRLIKRICV